MGAVRFKNGIGGLNTNMEGELKLDLVCALLCMECLLENKTIGAFVVYKGNSLCMNHFKEKKDNYE